MEELLTPFRKVRKIGSIGRKVFPGGGVIVDRRSKNTIDGHLDVAVSVHTIAILNEFYAMRKH